CSTLACFRDKRRSRTAYARRASNSSGRAAAAAARSRRASSTTAPSWADIGSCSRRPTSSSASERRITALVFTGPASSPKFRSFPRSPAGAEAPGTIRPAGLAPSKLHRAVVSALPSTRIYLMNATCQRPGDAEAAPSGPDSAQHRSASATRQQLAGAAGMFSLLVLLSRLLGFARDAIIAAAFGQNAITSAYLYALTLP